MRAGAHTVPAVRTRLGRLSTERANLGGALRERAERGRRELRHPPARTCNVDCHLVCRPIKLGREAERVIEVEEDGAHARC